MKIFSNIDLHKNEIQNFRIQNLAAAPTNPVIGQHYFNTADDTEYVFTSQGWIDALSQGAYTFKDGIIFNENTREVTLRQADIDNIGGVRLATQADLNNSNEEKAVTPKLLNDRLRNNVEYSDFTYNGQERKTIQLANYDSISGIGNNCEEGQPSGYVGGEDLSNEGMNLVMLSKWNVADFGSPKVHFNINTKDNVTINDNDVIATNKDLANYIKSEEKGQPNGVATLDADGLIPSSQLPSYVDDVIELTCLAIEAPATCVKGDKYYNINDGLIHEATDTDTWNAGGLPEVGKIYIDLDTDKSYRFGGTTLVQIGADKLLSFKKEIVGNGVTTNFSIRHGLGTRHVVVEVIETIAPYEKVYVQILHSTNDEINVVFSQAPDVDTKYDVVIIAIG